MTLGTRPGLHRQLYTYRARAVRLGAPTTEPRPRKTAVLRASRRYTVRLSRRSAHSRARDRASPRTGLDSTCCDSARRRSARVERCTEVRALAAEGRFLACLVVANRLQTMIQRRLPFLHGHESPFWSSPGERLYRTRRSQPFEKGGAREEPPRRCTHSSLHRARTPPGRGAA